MAEDGWKNEILKTLGILKGASFVFSGKCCRNRSLDLLERKEQEKKELQEKNNRPKGLFLLSDAGLKTLETGWKKWCLSLLLRQSIPLRWQKNETGGF